LQLRLHPAIIELKNRITEGNNDKKHEIKLTYITSRGNWYFVSWKGDVQKSGGITTNIGVHFFDMLSWIFGPIENVTVHLLQPQKASGYLELKNARVKWYLSIDYNDLPDTVKNKGGRTYRSISVDNKEVEFSEGFTDLHTKSYEDILAGKGFGLDEASNSINIVHQIRNSEVVGLKGEYHELCIKALK